MDVAVAEVMILAVDVAHDHSIMVTVITVGQ